MIDLAFANRKLISGTNEVKHTWNHRDVSDDEMVTSKGDFETIARGQRRFMPN